MRGFYGEILCVQHTKISEIRGIQTFEHKFKIEINTLSRRNLNFIIF